MKRRIEIIEAARGAAALYVMLGHVAWTAHEMVGYGGPIFRLFRYGHEAVILFFVISGFSIHYSYVDRPLNTSWGLKDYYLGRLRRIYPVFLVAFVLTIALGWLQAAFWGTGWFEEQQITTTHLLAQLAFLTDLGARGTWFMVPAGNAAFWSLSYEVAYYVLYPVFWRIAQRHRPVSILMALLTFSLLHEAVILLGAANHVSNVFGYYWIWGIGALLGSAVRFNQRPVLDSWRYFALLAFALGSVALLDNVTARRLNDWLWALVWGLFLLGYLADFQPRKLPAELLAYSVILFPAVAVVLLGLIPGSRFFLLAKLLAVLFLCLFLASDASNRLRFLGRGVLSPFGWSGSISYALYAIHLPVVLFSADLLVRRGFHPLWTLLSVPAILGLAWSIETCCEKVFGKKRLKQHPNPTPKVLCTPRTNGCVAPTTD